MLKTKLKILVTPATHQNRSIYNFLNFIILGFCHKYLKIPQTQNNVAHTL